MRGVGFDSRSLTVWIAAGAVSLGDVMEREHVPVTGSVGQGGVNEGISCERRRHTYTFCFGFSSYWKKPPRKLHNIVLTQVATY